MEIEFATKYHVISPAQQRAMAIAEIERLSTKYHMIGVEIDEEYFAKLEKNRVVTPAELRAEAEAAVAEASAGRHMISVEYDDNYFIEEAKKRNAARAGLEGIDDENYEELEETTAILINSSVYSSFIEMLNDLMYTVYLYDIKANRSELLTELQAAYLDADSAALSVAAESSSIRKTFDAMGFFSTNSFSDW
jgi:hypothetical protein